jgi:hypothetical protein
MRKALAQVVEICVGEDNRHIVTVRFLREMLGGAVEISDRKLWFKGSKFTAWPKAKTWRDLEVAATDMVNKKLAEYRREKGGV